MQNGIPKFLSDRLRRRGTPASVPGSLPVLFFGDLFTATIATIGMNPSRREYLSASGQELEGKERRFETLGSLSSRARSLLDDGQVQKAVRRMRGYFDPDKPKYAWFNALTRVIEGMGFSFVRRSATHLDLVQEATDPVWSQWVERDPKTAVAVLHSDLAFLKAEIETFPLRAVVATSARVLQEISAMFATKVEATGTLARVKWTVGVATTRRGPIGIAGWNIPLARATGLNREGQTELGRVLLSH